VGTITHSSPQHNAPSEQDVEPPSFSEFLASINQNPVAASNTNLSNQNVQTNSQPSASDAIMLSLMELIKQSKDTREAQINATASLCLTGRDSDFKDQKRGITKFSGDDDYGVHSFFLQVENLRVDRPDLTDRNLISAAVTRLRGTAAEYVSNNPNIVKCSNYDIFKQSLINYFEAQGLQQAENLFNPAEAKSKSRPVWLSKPNPVPIPKPTARPVWKQPK
jgi:hypothetical protein